MDQQVRTQPGFRGRRDKSFPTPPLGCFPCMAQTPRPFPARPLGRASNNSELHDRAGPARVRHGAPWGAEAAPGPKTPGAICWLPDTVYALPYASVFSSAKRVWPSLAMLSAQRAVSSEQKNKVVQCYYCCCCYGNNNIRASIRGSCFSVLTSKSDPHKGLFPFDS